MRQILLSMSLVVLVACGGGGGSGSQTSSFISSAALGEVIKYQVNLTNLTYEYEVLFSRFGCTDAGAACRTGSGKLTRQTDGTYKLLEV